MPLSKILSAEERARLVAYADENSTYQYIADKIGRFKTCVWNLGRLLTVQKLVYDGERNESSPTELVDKLKSRCRQASSLFHRSSLYLKQRLLDGLYVVLQKNLTTSCGDA